MIVVEVILKTKMILIGPFDNHDQALAWISELLEENPKEAAVIAVNDNHPDRIRVYIGKPEPKNKKPKNDNLVAPVFELFRG